MSLSRPYANTRLLFLLRLRKWYQILRLRKWYQQKDRRRGSKNTSNTAGQVYWLKNGLENVTGPFEWGEQVLYCVWPDMAVSSVCVPGDGVCCGRRACLGRRSEGLWLQHQAAWLRQRLLRPLLSHLPHPLVGPSAHLCHMSILHGGDACGIPWWAWAQASGQTWRE